LEVRPLALGTIPREVAHLLRELRRRHRRCRRRVVALGYDAHEDDPIGVLKLEAADFGRIVERVRSFNLPTLVQEGGYAIGDCLDAFLAGFKEASPA
jgi:acetoin utilization deacetylase AcuC-like enzyme